MNNINSKQCYFCTNNIKTIDHKDLEAIKKFIDPYARISAKRRTGVCALHQRKLTSAIKHARHLALLPFISR